MRAQVWKPVTAILVVIMLTLLAVGCDNPAGSQVDQAQNESGDGSGGQPGTETGDGTISGIADDSFVYVPPGDFQRDGSETNISEITQGFLMGQYPVTQADFEEIMGTNPSSFSSGEDAPTRPVEFVSWYHAIAFANKLSIARGLTPVYSVVGVNFNTLTFEDVPLNGNNSWDNAAADWDADGFRLPTEMERLWAAMGATSGHDYSGTGIYTTGYNKPFAGSTGSNSAADYAWYAVLSPQPVGQKLPNELEIYDMSGNVGEYVWDRNRTSPNYPAGTLTDYRGNDDTSVVMRVVRGGNWGSVDADLAIAGRNGLGFGGRDPSNQSNSFGFRLVRIYNPEDS